MTTETDASAEKKTQDYVLLPTTKLNENFEVSMFRTPNILLRELTHVFSNVTSKDAVFAILTCQHSETDLVKYNDEADVEKDRLLENFVEFAKECCDKLLEQGHWADYIE